MRRSPLRRGRAAAWFLALPVAMASVAALAADFPYERQLVLNASPMRGSKRIPGLDIDSKGDASIDLWCATAPAQLVVAGDTLTILVGNKSGDQCDADRMRADDALIATLQQVTGWSMKGDTLTLTGEKTLKFSISSH